MAIETIKLDIRQVKDKIKCHSSKIYEIIFTVIKQQKKHLKYMVLGPGVQKKTFWLCTLLEYILRSCPVQLSS